VSRLGGWVWMMSLGAGQQQAMQALLGCCTCACVKVVCVCVSLCVHVCACVRHIGRVEMSEYFWCVYVYVTLSVCMCVRASVCMYVQVQYGFKT